jgi:hypothetical protein
MMSSLNLETGSDQVWSRPDYQAENKGFGEGLMAM